MTTQRRTVPETEKKALRAMALRSRNELPADQRREKSMRIIERLCSLPGIHKFQSWFVYVSYNSEVATHGLIRRLLAEGKKVSVPTIDKAVHAMVPSRIKDFDLDLAPGTLGIREPKPGRRAPVPRGEIDVVITPVVACSADGTRIGYGGGYYDRFLVSFQGVSIGLAYDMQLCNRLPHDPVRDIPLDHIVTESSLIRCENRKL